MMRGVNLTRIACAALFFFILNTPPASLGAELSFAPNILSTAGDLEIGMVSQTNENRQGDKRDRSTATLLHERIKLSADGYVYHPRFLFFLTRFSESLNQRHISGQDVDFLNSAKGSTDYELRTIFLPTHPYNLELFTIHREAAAAGTFLRGQAGSSNQQGAIFNYKERPFSFHSSYVAGSVDSAANRTDTKTYRVNGAHFGSVMFNSAGYTNSEAVSSFGVRNARERYDFGNNIHLSRVTLDSRVNSVTSKQTTFLRPGLQTREFGWTERLAVPLPWNFDTHTSFGYKDEKNRVEGDPSLPESEDFNRSTNTSFNVSHHLYRSVVTNYTLNYLTLKSSSGEVVSRSDLLAGTYSKSIPSARFTTGISLGRGDAERVGTPTILDEVHTAALFGSFLLNQQNVIENTIQILVSDPSTGGLITLPQGDYLVNRQGNSVEITILSVLPATPQADPAFVYEFRASYSLSDESRVVTTSQGFFVKLDWLENLLSPYYTFLTSSQEVVSGSLAGGPDRTTAEIAGITTHVGHYSGLIEHQSYRSRLNPSETWKTTAGYQTPLADNTNVSTFLSYVMTNHPPSPSPQGETPGFRQRIMGADVNVDKSFTQKNLRLSAGGSYFVTESLFDSEALTLNTSLAWTLGLLGINGGAQLSRRESKPPTGRVALITQYYYVTVTRKLF